MLKQIFYRVRTSLQAPRYQSLRYIATVLIVVFFASCAVVIGIGENSPRGYIWVIGATVLAHHMLTPVQQKQEGCADSKS